MMNKKRIVIVKNPKLRHFRNALRVIIELSVYKEKHKLREEAHNYELGNPIRKRIIDQENDLQRALVQSICMCPVCGSTSSNMIFNSYDKYWHCLECYNFNQLFYQKHGEEYRYP
jgi:hypothetical protein